MNTAHANAMAIAATTPAEGERLFAALTTDEKVSVLVESGRLGFTTWMALRSRVPVAQLRALWPALATLSDDDWYACFPNRRVRLRHAWNGELDWNESAIQRPNVTVVVAVHRLDDGGFSRQPLYVTAQFATNTINGSYELSEDEVRSAIASAGASIPGVRVLPNVRAVR
jgi:hypothetical protein